MRILYLYRPVYPSFRAQNIQILQTAIALASKGHSVTILANHSNDERVASELPESLTLLNSPFSHATLSGLWFRAKCLQWSLGPKGWIIARDKRRLVQLYPFLVQKHHIALESHELDSRLHPISNWYSVEERALSICDVLICNCNGTLALWNEVHDSIPPSAVIHNATSMIPIHTSTTTNSICSFGSHHDYKAANWLATVCAQLPFDFEVIGSWDSNTPPPSNLSVFPPVVQELLPKRMAKSGANLLCLKDNLFGRHLSSPLKLWDYLASTRPIIAPRLPSIIEIVNMVQAKGIHYYRAGDKDEFTEACQQALSDSPKEPTLRTWDQRADEIISLFGRLM